jgi:hypothetical protein
VAGRPEGVFGNFSYYYFVILFLYMVCLIVATSFDLSFGQERELTNLFAMLVAMPPGCRLSAVNGRLLISLQLL